MIREIPAPSSSSAHVTNKEQNGVVAIATQRLPRINETAVPPPPVAGLARARCCTPMLPPPGADSTRIQVKPTFPPTSRISRRSLQVCRAARSYGSERSP
ncbi:hypothetical protein WMY93_010478 [Mugilogobius chulae]|uniref:Uncharacterized protein n=1 Tax=Mugilogobius chulae TaxID=88201 RepID=A0AAW0PHW9_9GOBI